MPDSPPNVKKLIANLAWVTPSDVMERLRHKKSDRERMKWKVHAENIKSQLDALRQTLRIPVTPSVTKHQILSLIAQRRGIPEPSVRDYVGLPAHCTLTTAFTSIFSSRSHGS